MHDVSVTAYIIAMSCIYCSCSHKTYYDYTVHIHKSSYDTIIWNYIWHMSTSLILHVYTVHHCNVVSYEFIASCTLYTHAHNPSIGSIERHLSTVHPLDQMIVELVKFLDVDRVRLGLIRRGILSQEEMETLLDVSLKNFPQSIKVETLVHIVKKKGDLGLQAFINALEETMDGTGHHSLVEQLKKLLDNYLL